MPMQQQNSSFAARLGARVSAANAEHKDKPVDTGNRRLPGGIRNGVAKLSAMYTKVQDADDGKTPKGETFFRASAIVASPKEFKGEKVEGLVTQRPIPLCDVPAKGDRKEKSFAENWYEFQNLFKLLGVAPPNETPETDPDGKRVEAYYFAAMRALTDPAHPPVYITFSTRSWTPPKKPGQQKEPEEMVFEEWHGLASPEQVAALSHHDPASSVREAPPAPSANGAHAAPAVPSAPVFDEFAPPPQARPAAAPVDLADEVAMLVPEAMDDPEGKTPEGRAAARRLEELAWGNGWTRDQTINAANWEEVGDMALTKCVPPAAAVPTMAAQVAASPVVGSKWKFARRGRDGAKLKNSKGVEFAPADVEVTAVDAGAKTCTVRTADGRDVVDIRSKAPVAVKWEWLES